MIVRYLTVLVLTVWSQVDAIKWLGLAHTRQIHWNNTRHCKQSRVHGLHSRQITQCKKQKDLMRAYAYAARATYVTCQKLFADRRWNCSSIRHAPEFTPDLTSGTREQAFVYALSAAAAVHSVARHCASGHSRHCKCGVLPKEIPKHSLNKPDEQFKWDGCSDNLRFGASTGKHFTDSPFVRKKRRKSKPKKSGLGRLLRVNVTSGSQTQTPKPTKATDSSSSSGGKSKKNGKRKRHKNEINVHNNAVGRQVVQQSLEDSCKCHGISGSCTLKTCWKSLKDLQHVGSILKNRYQIAVEVDLRKVGKKRMWMPVRENKRFFAPDEMIFYTKSPDYCRYEKRSGSIGTVGRHCDIEDMGAWAGCGSMCCGRGYVNHTKTIRERCNCQYIWCCYVKCDVCVRDVIVHTCR